MVQHRFKKVRLSQINPFHIFILWRVFVITLTSWSGRHGFKSRPGYCIFWLWLFTVSKEMIR